MAHRWDLLSPEPRELTHPVPLDPTGLRGPTRGQARGRSWRRASRNLYVPSDVSRQRVEQRIVEEAARLPTGGVVSGWAALRMHRVNFSDGLGRDLEELPVPVVLPPGTNMWPVGVERHRCDLSPRDRTTRFGVPVAVPERALFDAMSWADDVREAVVVADAAFASGVVSRTSFEAYVARRTRARGSAGVREALAFTETRSRSPMESRMRLIWLIDAGLPRPHCNWPVLDTSGRRVGRPDLLCDELGVAGEFDGGDHSGALRRAADASKEAGYRDLGLETFRIIGREIEDVALVVRRMRGAARRAEQSMGPRLWRLPSDPGPL